MNRNKGIWPTGQAIEIIESNYYYYFRVARNIFVEFSDFFSTFNRKGTKMFSILNTTHVCWHIVFLPPMIFSQY